MYPSFMPYYFGHPFYDGAVGHSFPFPEEMNIESLEDGRLFGGFFPIGQPNVPPPPFGSQGQGQGQPPFPPSSQGQMAGPPSSPPPSVVPTQQVQTFAVDPGSIRGCLFRFTYVWLRGNQQFWFYPTFVGRSSVSGWRWTGFRWVYFGTSLRQIQSFTCF